MQVIANMIAAAYKAHAPEQLEDGDWHLPYVYADEIARWGYEGRGGWETLAKLSVARCAAVSYERQASMDIDADLVRYEKLRASGHMSPFEHQAQVQLAAEGKFSGNFRLPFVQYRKTLPGEDVWVDPAGA